MMQVPTVQNPQAYLTSPLTAPSYNAVKIDVHNPQVNAPGSIQQTPAANYAVPTYAVPSASLYEVPQSSVYGPQQNFNQPPTVQQVPSQQTPQPVIVPPTVMQQPMQQPIQQPVQQQQQVQQPVAPEVKPPQAQAPTVDINAFIAKLTGENYDEQANAMEEIASMAQSSPQKATELLDVKVMDSLLGIMSKDSSKLAGPTPKQLEIREKIVTGKQVTDAEKTEANVITPMEQAERNKQYALYTTAILQKLFVEEIKKLNNTVVPLTELPGAAGVVEQVKSNPNPMVRASAIDALSYVQRPEYKQELQTVFSLAEKDQSAHVKEAAKKALERLAQVGGETQQPTTAPTQEQPAVKAA